MATPVFPPSRIPLCASCLRPCNPIRHRPPCCRLVDYCSSRCLSSDRSRHALFHSSLEPSLSQPKSLSQPPLSHFKSLSLSTPASSLLPQQPATVGASPPPSSSSSGGAASQASYQPLESDARPIPSSASFPPSPALLRPATTKHATEGKDLIFEAQKFFKCRSKIKKMWKKLSKGLVDPITSFDTINLPDGTFNPAMRQTSLDGSVVASLDDLYATATVANPLFLQCLRSLLLDLGIPSDRLDVYTLKKRPRAAEKAADDYGEREPGPGIAWLADIVRSSFVCETEEEVLSIVEYLLDLKEKEERGEVDVTKPRLQLVRLKNRFTKPTPGGFRDFNMNLVLVIPKVDGPGGRPEIRHVCELQVHLKALKDFGNQIGSHSVYEFFRTFFKGNMAAVEKRMQILERLLGDSEKGGGDDEDDETEDGSSCRNVVGGGGNGKTFRQSIFSLDAIVDDVISEGDVERVLAAYELLDLMSEYEAAVRILKALIKLYNPRDVMGLLSLEGSLAVKLSDLGKLAEAKALYIRVLEKQRKLLGAEHASSLITESHLAVLLNKLGEYEQAKKMYTSVLARQTKLLGAVHENTLVTECNLASLLFSMDEFSEAKKMHVSNIAKKTQVLGAEHADTLFSECNLANVLTSLGEYAQAKKLYTSVLAKRTKLLGAGHALTLVTEAGLANLLKKLGMFEESRKMLTNVHAKQKKLLGAEHSDTLQTERCLAGLLHELGDLVEAKKLYTSALSSGRRLLGEDNASTLSTERLFANLLADLGELEEAKKRLTKVFAMQTKVLGAENASTLETEGDLASVVHELGEFVQATCLYKSVLAKQIKVLGAEHILTIRSEGNLSSLLLQLGDYVEAKKLCASALAKKTKVLGPDHRETLDSEGNLACILGHLGDYVEEKKMFTSVIAKKTKALGADHHSTLLSEAAWAWSLKDQGLLQEAIPKFQRVFEKQKKVLGQNHPQTQQTAIGLRTVERMIAAKKSKV